MLNKVTTLILVLALLSACAPKPAVTPQEFGQVSGDALMASSQAYDGELRIGRIRANGRLAVIVGESGDTYQVIRASRGATPSDTAPYAVAKSELQPLDYIPSGLETPDVVVQEYRIPPGPQGKAKTIILATVGFVGSVAIGMGIERFVVGAAGAADEVGRAVLVGSDEIFTGSRGALAISDELASAIRSGQISNLDELSEATGVSIGYLRQAALNSPDEFATALGIHGDELWPLVAGGDEALQVGFAGDDLMRFARRQGGDLRFTWQSAPRVITARTHRSFSFLGFRFSSTTDETVEMTYLLGGVSGYWDEVGRMSSPGLQRVIGQMDEATQALKTAVSQNEAQVAALRGATQSLDEVTRQLADDAAANSRALQEATEALQQVTQQFPEDTIARMSADELLTYLDELKMGAASGTDEMVRVGAGAADEFNPAALPQAGYWLTQGGGGQLALQGASRRTMPVNQLITGDLLVPVGNW